MVKIGIVGSRRRATESDFKKTGRTFNRVIVQFLGVYFEDLENVTIVTGDCKTGGDEFARRLAGMYGCKLDVKYKLDPETGERVKPPINKCLKQQQYNYYEFTQICYNRNEEIAKEPLDYLIALVAPDRKGGTENTIYWFKRYHPNWEFKLILL